MDDVLGEILNLPAITKRIDKYFPELKEDEMINNALLKTIRVSKDLSFLSSKLPKPNYDSFPKRYETTRMYEPSNRSELLERKLYKKSTIGRLSSENNEGRMESELKKSKSNEYKPAKINLILERIKPDNKIIKEQKSQPKKSESKVEEYEPDFEDGNRIIRNHKILEKLYQPRQGNTRKNSEKKIKIPRYITDKKEREMVLELCYEDIYKSDPHIQNIINKRNKNISPIDNYNKKSIEIVKLPKVLSYLTYS